MPNFPKDFIGTTALEHVAEQVSKEILMGPGYTDAEEMDRLGIQVISGMQFKRTFNIFLRKGGTTRRKDVHAKVSSQAGFLKERTLTVKLTWDHFDDNIDNYCETPFGTDAQGQYPLSTQATEAILKDYADNLTACLWFGDIDLDNGDETVPAKDQALALYDGYHTCVKHDIEDALISEANGNLIQCDAIEEPADNNDSTPFDNFVDWYFKWDARLRKQKVMVYMDESTARNIAAGYANKYHGNFKVEPEAGDNFKLPGYSKVTICPVSDFGTGGRMYATVEGNFVYGVDTENNKTFVSVRVGSDTDHRTISFQIQSIQGAGIKVPFSSSLCVSPGKLENPGYKAGDYIDSNLTVTLAKNSTADAGEIDGSVKVNGKPYTDPVDTNANDVLTLEAVDGETNFAFDHWSNDSKEKKIQVIASGTSMAYTAFFKKKG